ncbi:MAG: ELM1/GtrOC1 family putative glycosyltransferase [Candidatus Omnitrophota bacterium]
MKQNYLAEYLLYIWVRALSGFFSSLPLKISLGIGRAVAMLGFIFNTDRKKTAYRNIRLALSCEYSPRELKTILKQTYLNWGMNFIEALMLPRIDKNYLDKYIEDEGLDYVRDFLNQDKGVVLMGSHFGSWEVLHIGIPQKGNFDFYILARPQKFKMASDYLDSLRREKKCFVVYKGMGSREAVSILKSNKAFGLVIDQGGRTEDKFIKFFGRLTPTPTGVVRFALKFNAPIVAGYIARKNGPYQKLTMLKPYFLEKKDTQEETVFYNLEKLNEILEGYVKKHPAEYFWFHKRWKYSQDKNILVLTDGKAGHLHQLESFLKEFKNIFNERSKGFNLNIKVVTVKFRSNFRKFLLNVYTFIFGKIFTCMKLTEFTLENNCFLELTNNFCDIVVSCGASTHAVNLIITKENYARSVVVMSAGIFNKRFNVAIIPGHDRPKQDKNIFITQGALNLIDKDYLKNQKDMLASRIGYKDRGLFKIGILLGGNTKDLILEECIIRDLVSQIKAVSKELSAQIFITTSRRTPKNIDTIIKNEFENEDNCKLLIIACENNIPEALGGMLGLCDIIVVSSDSISMISEAASSGKYVIVFDCRRLNMTKRTKHELFLESLVKENYVNFVNPQDIGKTIKSIFYQRSKINVLDNGPVLKEAISRLF